MAQFDVYANPGGRLADAVPYMVDIQARCVGDLPTRVLIPLARLGPGVKPARHLSPTVTVNGETLVLLTDQLAAMPSTILGTPIASLAERRTEIIDALDFLFTGI